MTPAPLEIIAIGFVLGMRHATDPDHVIAVSTIVSRERSIPKAGWIGALWGCGHTLTIFIVGAAIILLGLVIPARIGLTMEFSVGLMLILLGILNLTGAMRWLRQKFSPAHPPVTGQHAHLRAPRRKPSPARRRRTFAPQTRPLSHHPPAAGRHCPRPRRLGRCRPRHPQCHSRTPLGCRLSPHLRHWNHRRHDAHHRRSRPSLLICRLSLRLAEPRNRGQLWCDQPRVRPLPRLPHRFCRRPIHQSPGLDSALASLLSPSARPIRLNLHHPTTAFHFGTARHLPLIPHTVRSHIVNFD